MHLLFTALSYSSFLDSYHCANVKLPKQMITAKSFNNQSIRSIAVAGTLSVYDGICWSVLLRRQSSSEHGSNEFLTMHTVWSDSIQN